MESEDFLSDRQGAARLNPDTLAARIAAAAPGRRGAPDHDLSRAQTPRGDHDLNPDMYDPNLHLTAAAVLVPIVTHGADLSVLLTRRTDHLNDHAGQISFPGGRLEPHDDGPVAAALRETEEEVGLPARQIRPIGQLDVYVTRTGFEVTPVVALVKPPLTLRPDSFEVAEVFEVPLRFFLDSGNRETHSRIYQGVERQFYVYPFGSYYIWGATAGMLNNLAEVLAIQTRS